MTLSTKAHFAKLLLLTTGIIFFLIIVICVTRWHDREVMAATAVNIPEKKSEQIREETATIELEDAKIVILPPGEKKRSVTFFSSGGKTELYFYAKPEDIPPLLPY
ncbi:MAG TPA: hypothetical protein P5232_02800 [Candidatus Moranbacteria bacterium]|nr:hypothetical protein [Candidatus Moranbacteria bacterium]